MDDISKVFALYREIGVTPDTKSFENRIVMQKTICLLKLMGVKMGYQFSMYLRGPYCPALTKDIFAKIGMFNALAKKSRLSPDEIEKAKELKETSGLKASSLEIAATYGQLVFGSKKRPKEAIDILRREKPFYSMYQIMDGVSIGKQLLFHPSKEQLEALKREMKPWDQAADADFAKQVEKHNL